MTVDTCIIYKIDCEILTMYLYGIISVSISIYNKSKIFQALKDGIFFISELRA